MNISPLWGQIIGIFTVATMASFIGIWIWVWHSGHKAKYDALARMPMEDEEAQP